MLVTSLAHFRAQVSVELPLLKAAAPRLLLCCLVQYAHSCATRVVYHFHEVRPPLRDLGFALLPSLSASYFWLSEALLIPILFIGIATTLAPLFISRVQYNAVPAFARFWTVVSVCDVLRSISFLATVLPGPAPHCQDADNKFYNPPALNDVFFRWDVSHGCGDLVFSSHFIFALVSLLTVQNYLRSARGLNWFMRCATLVLGLVVLMSHKHYTLDVVVASYTVPLVWYWRLNAEPDMAEREGGEKEEVAVLMKERGEKGVKPDLV
jgi:hypothetical protein